MSVGEKGASALIKSLEHNKTMTELWLPWGLEEAKGSSRGEEENTFYIYNVIPVLLCPQVHIFYIISNSIAKVTPTDQSVCSHRPVGQDRNTLPLNWMYASASYSSGII